LWLRFLIPGYLVSLSLSLSLVGCFRGRISSTLTLVDIGKVRAKAVDRFQHRRPVDKIHELSVSIHIRPQHSRKTLPPTCIHLPLNNPQLPLILTSPLLIPCKSPKIRRHTPVRTIQRFDSLGVQVLDGLLVAAADAVRGAAVAVERVDRLGDAHLRGRHGAQRVEVAFGFFLQAQRGGFQRAVAPLFDFVLAVAGLFDLPGLHHDLRGGAADLVGAVSLLLIWLEVGE
jgi:hypothetical protein